MLDFNAPRILSLGQRLQALEMAIVHQSTSQEFTADEFDSDIVDGILSKIQRKEWKKNKDKRDEAVKRNIESRKNLHETTIRVLDESLNNLEEECKLLGLNFCNLELKRAKEKLKENGLLEAKDINVISARLLDELSLRKFIQIEPNEAEYYEPLLPLFGEIVAKEFPSVSYDITEAGKCYAMGRNTASVFHLMRVIEGGIHRLAQHLGVTLGHSGWNGHLDKLKRSLDTLPTGTLEERENRKRIERAHAHLNAIRLAWRNDTMHPVETYTGEEAGNLIQHTKLFMQSLGTIIS